MIPFLRDNSVVFLGLLSWFIAQLIKFIIEVSTHRRINWRRFFESEGMPSSPFGVRVLHRHGHRLPGGLRVQLFCSGVYDRMVVMYDAMGVRRAAGEQAEAINELREKISEDQVEEDPFPEWGKPLREALGHKLPRSSAARSWESRLSFLRFKDGDFQSGGKQPC